MHEWKTNPICADVIHSLISMSSSSSGPSMLASLACSMAEAILERGWRLLDKDLYKGRLLEGGV